MKGAGPPLAAPGPWRTPARSVRAGHWLLHTAAETTGKEPFMSLEDNASNKAEELKGQVKEQTGKATGNEELKAEGKADQASGNLKQAGEKVKDAFKS
jgi:uncharacterized protein YjbJ (UPF0337 family)